MNTQEIMSDDFLDAAATDAIGAHRPEESAAYQQRLASAGTAAATVDRQMRETVAALSAASPHVSSSAELRGRILGATAPKTFRMDDYRKATREDSRFYKWGFYAAAMFLMFAALYNMSYRGKLDQAVAAINTLKQQNANITNIANVQSATLVNALANPNNVQVTWKDDAGNPIGRGILDVAHRKAVLIFPQEILPNSAQPQFSLQMNNQSVAFETAVIRAPAVEIGMKVPANAPDIAKLLSAPRFTSDETSKLNEQLKVNNASMH